MRGFWFRFYPAIKRFFLNWRSPLLLLLALCLSLVSHAKFTLQAFPLTDFLESSPPTTQWTKGVWLTNVDSDVLYDPPSLKMAIADLSQTGFNTIYPTVWNDGHTLYPSTVAAELLGTERHPHPGLADRDFLADLIPMAKKAGLRVVPWFEFGFMAPAASDWVQAHADWLTQAADGEVLWMEGKSHQRVWLNPLHPQVQQLITGLALETVKRYDVEGIQFDDHFGYPSTLGYDPLTLQRYQQETGQSPPAPPDLDPNQNCVAPDPDWQAWTTWRSQQITDYVQQLVTTLKRAKPNLKISISPNPQTFSKNCFLLDWQRWQQLGLIDELVLQIYRDKQEAFERELAAPSVLLAKTKIPVVVGILTGLKNRPVPMDRIQQQTQWARNNGFAGISYFFYESLWHLTDESPGDRRAKFRQLLRDEGN